MWIFDAVTTNIVTVFQMQTGEDFVALEAEAGLTSKCTSITILFTRGQKTIVTCQRRLAFETKLMSKKMFDNSC
jgi:hypothetical protein